MSSGARRLSRLAPLVLTALALAPGIARGDEAAGSRADRLFNQGRAALEAGKYAEACPLLAESQELDPGTGTLLALALCHEAEGKTASAWREFDQVAQASTGVRADRASTARRHAIALESTLSRLRVSVTDAPRLAGRVHVRVDGQELPEASWDKPVPVDPGDHSVEASMEGAAPWSGSAHVGTAGDVRWLVVPSFDPAKVEEVAKPPSRPRVAAWATLGAGAAAVVVGGIVFGVGLGDHATATNACPASPCASVAGVDAENRAITEGWVSTVFIGAGLAALGIGTYLLVRREPARAARGELGFAPWASPSGGGGALQGTF